MKEIKNNLALVVLCTAVIVTALFLGIASIPFSIIKPYEYQGTAVISLAQYQKLVKRFNNTQSVQATAYDSVNDKILITYNFDGKSDTGTECDYSVA
jgi:hypothetical protein